MDYRHNDYDSRLCEISRGRERVKVVQTRYPEQYQRLVNAGLISLGGYATPVITNHVSAGRGSMQITFSIPEVYPDAIWRVQQSTDASDFNSPLEDTGVVDDTSIWNSLPTYNAPTVYARVRIESNDGNTIGEWSAVSQMN